jgi:hypothetical protein
LFVNRSIFCPISFLQHINHVYQYMDNDYGQILTLNHKLIESIRSRIEENRDSLNAIVSDTILVSTNLHMQTLLNSID